MEEPRQTPGPAPPCPASRRRQILFQDRDAQIVGDLTVLLVAVNGTQELAIHEDFDGLPLSLRRLDGQAIVAQDAAQVTLDAGDLGRFHAIPLCCWRCVRHLPSDGAGGAPVALSQSTSPLPSR